jgi:hypothetical protein
MKEKPQYKPSPLLDKKNLLLYIYMNFYEFLKKYTLINDKFIDDFYKLFDEKYI